MIGTAMGMGDITNLTITATDVNGGTTEWEIERTASPRAAIGMSIDLRTDEIETTGEDGIGIFRTFRAGDTHADIRIVGTAIRGNQRSVGAP